MGRSLLADKKLPKTLWAEAMNHAVYLLNRLPTNAVEGKIPLEALCGRKPSSKYLRIFWFIYYIHVAEEMRRKLDDKAKAGIFLGNNSETKVYRIYHPEIGKVMIRRHFVVNEAYY